MHWQLSSEKIKKFKYGAEGNHPLTYAVYNRKHENFRRKQTAYKSDASILHPLRQAVQEKEI